jgi:radical SAM superfamily enzyme YgiQ (UPF0313 family)
MRIYLVNPSMQANHIHTTFYSQTEAADITGKPGFIPNLACPTLAALTPEDIEVEICDETVEPVDFDKPCDLVGITGYVTQAQRIFELARAFRARGRLVAIGGPFASLSPERCRPHADILFTGEAERTWPAFLEDFRRGTHRDAYREAENVDITRLPKPRMDLLRNDLYAHGVMQASRGCPFECEFCDVIVYLGRRIRYKTVEQILREAEALYDIGYRGIFISDDNFTANRKKATEILSALCDWNRSKQPRPVIFGTQLSIDIARNPEILELCAEAGLRIAFVGIETPNKSALAEVKKRQNLASDLTGDIREMLRHGILVQAGVIVGFDHDTTDVFQEQFEFLQEAGVPICGTGMLNAPEGTPLEHRLRREGRLVAARDDFYVETNIIPKQMSRDELSHGHRWLLNRLYHAPHFLDRVRKVCEVWPRGGAAHLGTTLSEAITIRDGLLKAYAALGPEFSDLPDRCFQACRKARAASAFVVVGQALIQYKHIVALMKRSGWWDPSLATASDPWQRYDASCGHAGA